MNTILLVDDHDVEGLQLLVRDFESYWWTVIYDASAVVCYSVLC